MINIRFPVALFKQLREIATKQDTNIPQLIIKVMTEYTKTA